ncbi:hypothetical protein [Vibrio parahaemolyticus]|uniref:hypothetical protein n=1 Tax=Vibrio parahaemolyticus TaxID=670 RepID=UPI001B8200FC|nr:hypothetical protein [Vibrio parahaemolyticus]WHT06206.1 hypothetical protein O2T11_25135 [Vibrio parahaemolyticus]HBC3903191.1 hypothetical protein [Vibrio parahaemolyticus]
MYALKIHRVTGNSQVELVPIYEDKKVEVHFEEGNKSVDVFATEEFEVHQSKVGDVLMYKNRELTLPIVVVFQGVEDRRDVARLAEQFIKSSKPS